MSTRRQTRKSSNSPYGRLKHYVPDATPGTPDGVPAGPGNGRGKSSKPPLSKDSEVRGHATTQADAIATSQDVEAIIIQVNVFFLC